MNILGCDTNNGLDMLCLCLTIGVIIWIYREVTK